MHATFSFALSICQAPPFATKHRTLTLEAFEAVSHSSRDLRPATYHLAKHEGPLDGHVLVCASTSEVPRMKDPKGG